MQKNVMITFTTLCALALIVLATIAMSGSAEAVPQKDNAAWSGSKWATAKQVKPRKYRVKIDNERMVLRPCKHEDSTGPCIWDARKRGNGKGRSFVVLPVNKQDYRMWWVKIRRTGCHM